MRFPGLQNRIQIRQRLATAATFLQSCVAQALSCGDGARPLVNTSAYYHEYDEDFDFQFVKHVA